MSEKQEHRARAKYMGMVHKAQEKADHYKARCVWLEHRPPWWKFWAVRKWKGEEPT